MGFWDFERFSDAMNAGKMAARLGYQGVCIISQYKGNDAFRSLKSTAKEATKAYGIEVTTGIELGGSLGAVKRDFEKTRNMAELISVKGDYSVKRWACATSVDLISAPWVNERGAGIDHIIAREAQENGIGFEIPLYELLQVNGKQASRSYFGAMECARVAAWSGAEAIITSGARNEWQMKGPYDLQAFGKIIGARLGDSKKIVENREKLAGKMIARGVRVV